MSVDVALAPAGFGFERMWSLGEELEAELRVERKLVFLGRAAPVDLWIRRQPALFRRHHPPRAVHSLYLDDLERSRYRESVEGAPQRAKLRLRTYPGADPRVWLEAKLKRGHTSRKVRFLTDLSGPELDEDTARASDLLARLRRQAPPALAAGLSDVRPSLHVAYQRRYSLDESGRIRATLDEELRFRRPGARRWVRGAARLVELKYGAEDEDAARRGLQQMPARWSRFSKYVDGLEATR